MASDTESVTSRKRMKSDTTSGTAFLLLLAFLVACALLWFGYQNLKRPDDRYASRIYRTASLTTASRPHQGRARRHRQQAQSGGWSNGWMSRLAQYRSRVVLNNELMGSYRTKVSGPLSVFWTTLTGLDLSSTGAPNWLPRLSAKVPRVGGWALPRSVSGRTFTRGMEGGHCRTLPVVSRPLFIRRASSLVCGG